MKCVSGWIKVCRDMRTHPLVGFGQQVKPWDESVKTCYSRAEAWLDLIMSASYVDAEVASGRKRVAVTQGQVAAAIRYLSKRWNWSVKAVRGFLDRLENDGMIERQTPDRTVSDELRKPKDANTDITLLTLCNYSAYQVGCISEGHSKGTARAQQGHKDKESKNLVTTVETPTHLVASAQTDATADAEADPTVVEVKTRSPSAYPQAFEEFWRAYPETRGQSKKDAYAAWGRLKAEQQDAAMRALPAFAADLRARRAKHADATCLHAVRYLRQQRFETLAPEPEAPAKAQPWWMDKDRVRAMTPERWRKGIGQYANGIWPVDKLGPPPGRDNCVVPADLLAELRLTERYTDAGIERRTWRG